MTRSAVASKSRFQSTLPARGATAIACLRLRPRLPFQSTLPARGATERRPRGGTIIVISIHAPRTGSDCEARTTSISGCYFNPRSPHGERLRPNRYPRAPLYFNPRSPHGERPTTTTTNPITRRFQSTLPARGATQRFTGLRHNAAISIHAPRTGSDTSPAISPSASSPFQSTLPARGATQIASDLTPTIQFQSTLPARGATRFSSLSLSPMYISIHAPRTGSDSVRLNPRLWRW